MTEPPDDSVTSSSPTAAAAAAAVTEASTAGKSQTELERVKFLSSLSTS